MNFANEVIENLKFLYKKKTDAELAKSINCSPASLSAFKVKNLIGALFEKIYDSNIEDKISYDAIFLAKNKVEVDFFQATKELALLLNQNSNTERIKNITNDINIEIKNIKFVNLLNQILKTEDAKQFFSKIAEEAHLVSIDYEQIIYVFVHHFQSYVNSQPITYTCDYLTDIVSSFNVQNEVSEIKYIEKEELLDFIKNLDNVCIFEIVNSIPKIIDALNKSFSNHFISIITKLDALTEGRNIFDKLYKIMFVFDALKENMTAAFLLMLYNIEDLKKIKKPISYKKFLLEAIDNIPIDKKYELFTRSSSKNKYFTLVVFDTHKKALKKLVIKELNEIECIAIVENYPQLISILFPQINFLRIKSNYETMFKNISFQVKKIFQ